MAFTFCTNCGEKIDDSEQKCPHCGHPKGADRSYRYGQEWYGNSGNNENNNNSNNSNNNNNNNSNDGNSGSQNQNDNGQQNQYHNPYGQYQPPFGNNNGNGGQQNQNQNPYGQNPYGQNGQYGGGYNNNGNYGGYNNGGYNGQYQPPFGQQTPWRQPQPQRQTSVALVIFSVINIIFGCCCIGMVFGVIGLFFALNARNAQTDEEEARRKKISLALNIVGVALTVIYAVVYVITILAGLAGNFPLQ